MGGEPKRRRHPRWTSKIPPAPGDLRIVQALVNTLDVEKQVDELGSPGDLGRWLATWHLSPSGLSPTEAEWRQARELREGLRALLVANTGGAAGAPDTRGLERVLGDLPLRCRLRGDGSFELRAVSRGWPEAAAAMLTIVTRAMGRGVWGRLKACRRDECHWAFYDSSKNHSGRWCAMDGCGNVMKARAYRQRVRQRSG